MSDVQTRTYNRYLAQLTSLLGANPHCCLALATELTSRKLIAFDTLASAREKAGIDRALIVLGAVRPTIRDDPIAFGKFVSALEQEAILCPVAGKMRREADLQLSAGNVTSGPTAAGPAREPLPSERRETNPGWSTCHCKPACIPLFTCHNIQLLCIDLIKYPIPPSITHRWYVVIVEVM